MDLIGKELGMKEFREKFRVYPRESVAIGLF